MRRRLLLVAGVFAGAGILAAAGTAAARAAWPLPQVADAGGSLVRVSLSGLGGRLQSVRVLDPKADEVPVRVADGDVWPLRKLRQGERLVVQVTVRRPGWAGWLVGETATRTFVVTTPRVGVRDRILHVPHGGSVAVRLAGGADVVSVDGVVRHGIGRVVPIRTTAPAGSVEIAAAARTWETLSDPVRVSWFPVGADRALVTSPAPGASLGPLQRVTLSFSSPIPHPLPALHASAAGRWTVVDDHSVAFEPTAAGYPLGGSLRVVLPKELRAVVPSTGRIAGRLSWPVAAGKTLRLQQLLAQLGYLPLRWNATGPMPARTPAAQVQAAVTPPAGTFTWRWAHAPAALRALWKPGTATLTRGALMRFEDAHGLPVSATPDPAVWRALFADVAAGRLNTAGYTYVLVHETVPQALQLWHNGKLVLRTPGNTGIFAAPTEQGTFAVFEHIPVGTMSGTNPDGSHYNDPGVRWISYFNGGDAIHAFYRPSYGTPQSLGCVELPYTAAEQVWPYTPVGTIVTVAQ